MYQLCLRWFGRERLDALMTTAQVVMAVAMVVASQAVPQLIGHFDGRLLVRLDSWWVWLLPPAWFAAFDDALAGRGAAGSWALAAMGLLAAAAVLWFAFGRLARDYETGLQTLNQLIPCLGGKGVPFSLPNEEAKSAARGLQMMAVMMISFALSGLAMWSWSSGWFLWLLLAETVLVFGLHARIRAALAAARRPSLE